MADFDKLALIAQLGGIEPYPWLPAHHVVAKGKPGCYGFSTDRVFFYVGRNGKRQFRPSELEQMAVEWDDVRLAATVLKIREHRGRLRKYVSF